MPTAVIVNARFLTQNISGVQRFAIEISKNLRKLYPNLIFLTPKDIQHKELQEELKAEVIGSKTGHLWEQIDLPIYVKKNYKKYILINFCNTAPYFLYNQFITVHDVSYLHNKSWFSFAFRSWYSFLVPKLTLKARKIFTVSEFSRSEIRKYIPSSTSREIIVVHNSISDIFQQEITEQKETFILSVASMDPRKNLSRLIKAFELVAEAKPKIKLVLAGAKHKAFSGEIEKEIPENLKERIVFTGYLTDEKLAELYRKAQLFVYISLYEGFGIPPLEAMASGCPVLLSEIPCLKEICGNVAYYCNPHDPENIANNMKALLEKEFTLQELKKLKSFTHTYSWAKSAEIFKKELDKEVFK